MATTTRPTDGGTVPSFNELPDAPDRFFGFAPQLPEAPDPYTGYSGALPNAPDYSFTGSYAPQLPGAPDPFTGSYAPQLPGAPDPYTGNFAPQLPGAPEQTFNLAPQAPELPTDGPPGYGADTPSTNAPPSTYDWEPGATVTGAKQPLLPGPLTYSPPRM